MATIHSLPVEILARILELGSPWPADVYHRPTESYAFLCHASLVSHAWTVAAQERLWINVVLRSGNQATMFIRSSVESGRTTVALQIEGSLSGDELVRVMKACDGLSRLHIVWMSCWEVLGLPATVGLTSLSLNCIKSGQVFPATLPFKLKHLKVDEMPPLPFLETLLQPTLTSLSLSFNWTEPGYIPTLARIAHQLTSLAIFIPDLGDFAVLQPFLSACVHLAHLSVETCDLATTAQTDWTDAGLEKALQWIPASLSTYEWVDRRSAAKGDAGLLSRILKASPSLVSPSSLRLLRWIIIEEEEEAMSEQASMQALRAWCEERGIRVEFEKR